MLPSQHPVGPDCPGGHFEVALCGEPLVLDGARVDGYARLDAALITLEGRLEAVDFGGPGIGVRLVGDAGWRRRNRKGGAGMRDWGVGEYCPRSIRVVCTTAISRSIITLAAMASAATAAKEVARRPAMPTEKPWRNRALTRSDFRPRAALRCANPGPMDIYP